MPLYEYHCQTDGTTLELLRPIADADKPIDDPEGKGRQFNRIHSTFAPQGGPPTATRVTGPASRGGSGGCCPCGKSHGGCARAIQHLD